MRTVARTPPQPGPDTGPGADLGVGSGAAGTPGRRRAPGRSMLLGPAFVAAIAYVDPGNVAANITAGSRYGYLLLWVLVVASAMAVLV